MSRRGANWYPREPHAYLGGVRGLPSKLHAVYGVIMDLIYDGGGECPNDPKWISGWFSDLGPASVRSAISDLCDRKKLSVDGDFLTNKRATAVAKTDRETKGKRRESGRKGGQISGERRAEKASANIENNDLGEASASTKNEPDKSTLEKKKERATKVASKKTRISASSFPSFISSEKAQDYLDFRRAKRAPVTSGVMKALTQALTELHTEGIDPDGALVLAMSRNWQGFQAEWVRSAMKQERSSGDDRLERIMRMADGADRRAEIIGEADSSNGAGVPGTTGLLPEGDCPGDRGRGDDELDTGVVTHPGGGVTADVR